MKQLLLTVLFFLGIGSAYAQLPGTPSGGQGQKSRAIPGTATDNDQKTGNTKITGFVVDSALTKAVEFASIALYNQATNKPVDGVVADDKGKFTLTRVAEGTYKLLITFIGFNTKTIPNVKVSKAETVDMGVIKLSASVQTLQEVTVTGQREMVEEKVDRLVYNADRDLTAKGGDATDILRKVPMLSVDLDGNVQLRGNSNVQVLINGKPSTIVASSIADALKQIPSDMIKTVEVITSPSAKYDAEGSGGIINIITKKNNLQGFTLNVDAAGGNRGASLGLNGNYRRGKIGFSLNGHGRASYNVKGKSITDQTSIVDEVSYLTRQASNSMNKNLFGTYSLGMDYDISKTSSLIAKIRFGTRNGITTQGLNTNIFKAGTQTSTSWRDIDSKDLSGTFDGSVDYTKTFKPQQELSISGQYSRNNRTNNYVADILASEGGEITSRQKNDNTSYNQEITFQTDYQTPMGGKNQLLEVGAKGIFRQVESDYKYYVSTGTQDYVTDTTRTANLFNYNQNIMASYVSYQLATDNKWNFKIGGRYEYTLINADFKSSYTIDIPDYGNFVPSINVSKLINGKTIKWAYSRRLQRPGIQSLNPNLNLSNPQNISLGNPFLKPELTDNFEMSWSNSFKGVYLNLTGFYRYTGNSINSVRSNSASIKEAFAGTAYSAILNTALANVADDAVVTTSSNIGKEQTVGVNIFGNINITPKISIGGGSDIMYLMLSNGGSSVLAASNSGFTISGRFNVNITLKNNWAMQGFGFIRGRQVQLQGYDGGFGFYNFGIRKEFADKKASVGFGMENFLNFGGYKVHSEYVTSTITQYSTNIRYNTGFRISFSYKIGKMSFNQSQKRRKGGIENDDIKSDGSGDVNSQPQQQNNTSGGRPGGGVKNR
ncbi:MAG: TonB-dependent receptor [Siphonobacter sp.]